MHCISVEEEFLSLAVFSSSPALCTGIIAVISASTVLSLRYVNTFQQQSQQPQDGLTLYCRFE